MLMLKKIIKHPKDVIIEVAYAKYNVSGHFAHWFGCMAAFFTAFYSFRLVYLTFLAKPNGLKGVIGHAHEVPLVMGIPLIILAFGNKTFREIAVLSGRGSASSA